MTFDEALEIIRSRRSVRRFKPERVPRDTLLKLVDAARLAPSGMNIQALEFVIVDEPETAARIFPFIKWAAYISPAGDPPPGHEPTAYVVILINPALEPRTPKHDVGAAAENLMIAATAAGLGSCWLGAINRPKIAEVLAAPDGYEVDTMVALGVPDEAPVVEPVEGGSILYWKDEAGALHVPKRGLEAVTHINRYVVRSR